MSAALRTAAAADSPGANIEIARLGRSFGSTPVLTNLSLRIEPGSFLAIVGRSGSGKSSLLRLICGLDQPTTGRIRVGEDLAGPGVARLMFQEPRLLPWAWVIDNVTVGLPAGISKAEARVRAAATLRAVGLESRAGDWPTALSGGQKQRVALARALVSRPRVLLLDEPLGALDALTRLEMQALIERAWLDQGFTAVLVTHDVPEAVRLADRVVLLENGAVSLDLQNPAPHPRGQRTPETVALEDKVLGRLMGAL